MNYYNPYFYNIPINMHPQRVGLLSRLFNGQNISFSGILNSTQKVLNVANQTIPLVKQIKPVVGNMKTMFKVMNEFKKNDKFSNNHVNANTNQKNNSYDYNTNNNTINNNTYGPTFFA